jgi:hypothetical protein
MSPDLAMFLGMLTADGHVTKSNYVVGLTKNCPATLGVFKALLLKLFNLVGRELVDPRNGVTGVSIGSKSLQEFLLTVGFSKQRIPDSVLSAYLRIFQGFISMAGLLILFRSVRRVCRFLKMFSRFGVTLGLRRRLFSVM